MKIPNSKALPLSAALVLLLFSSSVLADPARDKARQILDLAIRELPGVDSEPETVRQHIYYALASLQVSIGDIPKADLTTIKDPALHDQLLARIAAKEAQRNDVDAAAKALSQIKEGLYQVDAHTGVGEAFAVSNTMLAQEHFKQALDQAVSLPHHEDELSRLTALIHAQVKTHYVRLALDVVKQIENEKESCPLLLEIIAKADQEELFTLMHTIARLKPDICGNDATAAVAVRQVSLGQEEKARETLEGIPDPSVTAEALKKMALENFQDRRGGRKQVVVDLQKATRLTLGCPDSIKKASLLREIAVAQMTVGDKAGARVNFQRDRLVSRRMGEDLKIKASEIIELGNVEHGFGLKREAKENFQEAKRMVFGIAEDDPARAQRLILLAESFGATGADPFESKALYQQALSLAAQLEVSPAKAALYVSIGVSQFKAGFQKEALETLQKARLKALELPDEKEKSRALGSVVIEYVRIGQLDAAGEVLEDIPDASEKADRFGEAMSLDAELGRADEAVETAYAHSSKALKIRGLLGAAEGILKKDAQDKAKK